MAVMDNDGMFVAPVTPRHLFSKDGKPIVIGKQILYTRGQTFKLGAPLGKWAVATEMALGQPMVLHRAAVALGA